MTAQFASVWIRRGLENMPEVDAFLRTRLEMPRVCFGSPSELKVDGVSTGEETSGGKRVLVVDRGAWSLLEPDAPFGFSE